MTLRPITAWTPLNIANGLLFGLITGLTNPDAANEQEGGRRLGLRALLAFVVDQVRRTLFSEAPRMATAPDASAIDEFGERKARMILLTDLDNEPDDQETLTRLVLYSNEIDIEAIVATTSYSKWSIDRKCIAAGRKVLDAYAEVYAQLREHDAEYPDPQVLDSRFVLGQNAVGMAGVGRRAAVSDGARAILTAMAADDDRPVWICIGGGPNTLAAALYHARETLSRPELDRQIAMLRVYAISDQDNSGQWIRENFPHLHWVGEPSPTNAIGALFSFVTAQWTGISGEPFYRPWTKNRGANSALVTKSWLSRNIQAKGPLGAAYPPPLAAMEGDTPDWFWLAKNGLAGDRNPSWGGWGGRYVLHTPPGETRPMWTRGPGSSDTVVGFDGQTHTDQYASIYRWREAYQFDFANRMDWTIRDVAHTNHAPKVTVNGIAGTAPIYLECLPGQALSLNTDGTHDPDGEDNLDYHWFHYPEAGTSATEKASVRISEDGPRGAITVNAISPGTAHLILAVRDHGNGNGYPMTSYRRVVLTVAG